MTEAELWAKTFGNLPESAAEGAVAATGMFGSNPARPDRVPQSVDSNACPAAGGRGAADDTVRAQSGIWAPRTALAGKEGFDLSCHGTMCPADPWWGALPAIGPSKLSKGALSIQDDVTNSGSGALRRL